jgi:hypothetical protein
MSGPNSKRTDVTTDYALLPGDYKPDFRPVSVSLTRPQTNFHPIDLETPHPREKPPPQSARSESRLEGTLFAVYKGVCLAGW